jgi:NTE family protein
MMQSIITNKLRQCRPDILIRPPVSRFRVLDFMKVDAVMAETASVKDEVKRAIETAVEARLDGGKIKGAKRSRSTGK